LLFTLAILDGLQQHGGILRAAIASASNDHRLGGHEAPPGIITAFLGEHISETLNSIEEKREIKSFSRPQLQTIKVGGTILDLKLATLPNIERDLTDRNRTSPFAFTGNKFEFRAVGSKQSPSFPVSMINAIVAKSIRGMIESLKKAKGGKENVTDEDKLEVIREYIKKTKGVRFEGNNYSDDWLQEAQKRGLPIIKDSLNAFSQLKEPSNKQMLTDPQYGVFSESELESRYCVLVERYCKDILVEGETFQVLIDQYVIPAVFKYRKTVAESLKLVSDVGCTAGPEKEILNKISASLNDLYKFQKELESNIQKAHKEENMDKQAAICRDAILPLMEKAREKADYLESVVSDADWQLPKFHELLLL